MPFARTHSCSCSSATHTQQGDETKDRRSENTREGVFARSRSLRSLEYGVVGRSVLCRLCVDRWIELLFLYLARGTLVHSFHSLLALAHTHARRRRCLYHYLLLLVVVVATMSNENLSPAVVRRLLREIKVPTTERYSMLSLSVAAVLLVTHAARSVVCALRAQDLTQSPPEDIKLICNEADITDIQAIITGPGTRRTLSCHLLFQLSH